MPDSRVPELTIRTLLTLGRDAVTANPSILDFILQGAEAADLTSLKAHWAKHPPTILTGYARSEGPFPAWAVVLMGDNPNQDYLGLGERLEDTDLDELFDDEVGRVRTSGVFGIHVYAQHPDVCLAHYRVLRYILNLGRKWLIGRGLQEPQLTGAELAPDPRYLPDQLFVRRLTLTVEFEETWKADDAVAAALYTPTVRLSPEGGLRIAHEDADVDGDGLPDGGIHPIDPFEED